MRKFKFMGILLLALMLFACSTRSQYNFVRTTENILEKSKQTYDMITDSVIILYESGLMSSSDYAKIEAKANLFAMRHNQALSTLQSYVEGVGTGEEFADVLSAMSSALTELIGVAAPHFKL